MSLRRQIERAKVKAANGGKNKVGFDAIREAAKQKKYEAIKARYEAQKAPTEVKIVENAPPLAVVKETAKKVACAVCGKPTTAKSGICAACQKAKKEAV